MDYTNLGQIFNMSEVNLIEPSTYNFMEVYYIFALQNLHALVEIGPIGVLYWVRTSALPIQSSLYKTEFWRNYKLVWYTSHIEPAKAFKN